MANGLILFQLSYPSYLNLRDGNGYAVDFNLPLYLLMSNVVYIPGTDI